MTTLVCTKPQSLSDPLVSCFGAGKQYISVVLTKNNWYFGKVYSLLMGYEIETPILGHSSRNSVIPKIWFEQTYLDSKYLKSTGSWNCSARRVHVLWKSKSKILKNSLNGKYVWKLQTRYRRYSKTMEFCR